MNFAPAVPGGRRTLAFCQVDVFAELKTAAEDGWGKTGLMLSFLLRMEWGCDDLVER